MINLDRLFEEENKEFLGKLEADSVRLFERLGGTMPSANTGAFPSFPNFPSAPTSFPVYKSPLLDHEWSSYPLDTFKQKFFDTTKVIEPERDFNIYFGAPPGDGQKEKIAELHKEIHNELISYIDKNNNNKYDQDTDAYKGTYLKLTLFMSTDGAWLLEKAKQLDTVADDALVIFIETTDKDHNDNISDNVLLCKGGRIAATYYNQPALSSWVGLYSTVKPEVVGELIKNCANKDLFLYNVRSAISGFGKVISWLPGILGDFLCWSAHKIESLDIEKETWNKDRVTPLLDFLKGLDKNIHTLFYEDLKKGYDSSPGVGWFLPDAIIDMLRALADVVSDVIVAISGFINTVGKLLEFVFALVCGIINGILDLISCILLFVGTILKLISAAAKAVAKAWQMPIIIIHCYWNISTISCRPSPR